MLPSTPPISSHPDAISAIISNSDSVRGSSAVITVKSASSAAMEPIQLRLDTSRNPAEPNTTIMRPLAIFLTDSNNSRKEFGV